MRNWYNDMGRPSRGLAPMVDGSDLPYRLLVRRYGVQLTWTPMYNAPQLQTNEKLRKTLISELHTGKDCDRPLVLQLAGHDPAIVAMAYDSLAQEAGDCFDIVELNMGCPQAVALRGHYGAWLMDKPDIYLKVLGRLVTIAHGRHHVAVKTRIWPTREETLKMCTQIADIGVDMLTLHGRLRTQRTGNGVGPPNWEMLGEVFGELRRQFPSLVLFANGGVWSRESHERLLAISRADGTLAGSQILENAALYNSVAGLAGVDGSTLSSDLKEQLRLAEEKTSKTISLVPCTYKPSSIFLSFDLEAPVYSEVVKGWTPPLSSSHPITVTIGDSIERRLERIYLALEYIELARAHIGYITPSHIVSHTMRLVGRELMAANVDLRTSLTENLTPFVEYLERAQAVVVELCARFTQGRCCLPEPVESQAES
ncbi:putative tRNA dihydrouridine synthase [Giardia muris]|uniref:Putative tRNA dihydrouridine synthase n=1 Tax=Giardia muris TaxID=5742 RepID=A0A4Z1SQI2_GIAMU|nr:putative tRNA dihydrouridine synthase [Giardia muris]|eukprot:TNJ27940.1 putative tRNA dihydrouridine synthase [Giardia muris]